MSVTNPAGPGSADSVVWWAELFGGEADGRVVAITRIAVGVAAVAAAIEVRSYMAALTDPGILRIPYFEWAPEFGEGATPLILGAWIGAATFFLVGWRTRLFGALLTTMIFLVLAIDQQLYSNHLYLLGLICLLLTAADSGRSFSADARFRRNGDGRSRASRVARWPITLLMILVSIVYGFSALSKINASFLSGRVLFYDLRRGVIALPDFLYTPSVLAAAAFLVVMTEAFLTLALWSERWRVRAALLGVGMHCAIVLTMGPLLDLTIFGLELSALYILFLEEETRLVLDSPGIRWRIP